MSAKKNCVTCGKQIPDVAVVCVFCSAKQPGAEASASTESSDSPETIASTTIESESALSKPRSAKSANVCRKRLIPPRFAGARCSPLGAQKNCSAGSVPGYPSPRYSSPHYPSPHCSRPTYLTPAFIAIEATY